MQRRSVLKLVVIPFVARATSVAHADCAMPQAYATLVMDLTTPMARDGGLVATVNEGFGVATGPAVVRAQGSHALGIDATLRFVAAGRDLACSVAYLGGGLFKLTPSSPFPDGEVELVGFHAPGRDVRRAFAVSGVVPAPLPIVSAVSATFSASAERSTRWGAPTRHRAEIVLDRALPPQVVGVLFERSAGEAVRFDFERGARRVAFDVTVGGHCGGDTPPGGVLPSEGMEGRIVLVDRYGRLSRSTRLVRLG